MRVREEMRSDISDRNACLLVAEKKGTVVGYALGRLHPVPPMYEGKRLGIIHELAVTERARGRGMGKRLAGQMMEWFRDRRADRVELTVLVDNEEARAFWEKVGFHLTGLRYERRFGPPLSIGRGSDNRR
jgi:ribosomal protein S18 acetylase RimI-like enzyme